MLKKLQDLFKSRKQKGQSLIFFAASAPIICAFIGAAMDFCWMYYNQSRLQNAADAAATAGAASLLEDEMPLSDYSYTTLIPVNNAGLQRMASQDITSSRIRNKGTDEKPVAGDSIARYYAKHNLESWNNSKNHTQVQLVSNDDIGVIDNNGTKIQNVKFETELYGKDTEDYEALYYTVTLTTKLEHLFGSIMDVFGIQTLPAKAISVVKISHIDEIRKDDSSSDYPHGPTLYDQMKKQEVNETYPNWEEVKVQKGNNATAANNRSVLTGGAYYGSGNINRTEVSWLNGNAFASSKGNPYKTGIDQTTFDDLFIDFQGEMNKSLVTNGDHDLDAAKTSGNWDFGTKLSDNHQYSYRVHFPVMITDVYKVRKSEGKEPPDCLYAFIEQEPIKQSVTLSDNTTYTRGNMSSVRQIIINNDTPNTNKETDRPIVFFYEGPEVPLKKYHPELYDENDYIGNRPYLPVILNLYADFRGILFAPNNPVIINGNGYKLEGFVVGREFRRLKLAADFENAKYTSGNDQDKPVYISAFYNGSSKYKLYAEVSNWREKTSSLTNGYKECKIIFNGNEVKAWVKNKQWYTLKVNPDESQYAQMKIDGATDKYSFFKDILIETTLNGKTYLVNYNGKYYIPITTESVTYSGNVDSRQIGSVFSSSGKTITQKVCPVISGINEPMYISGTKYTYTETYLNTEGKMKTKTTIMSVGDVQYEYIGTIDATLDEDGNYTEKPGDIDSFTSDDKVRYDYTKIFNLKSTSTYNSFYNVGLVNYTYLAKTEGSAKNSHDMFFTTVRSKHID